MTLIDCPKEAKRAKRVEVKREERKYRNRGVEIDLPQVYDDLEARCIDVIYETLKPYPRATRMYEILVGDLRGAG